MTESQHLQYPAPARRRHHPVWVIFLLMAGVLGVSQWLGRERVPWGNDLAAAMTQAKGAKKPVLACFTAERCGPCLNMKRNVWTDQKVAAAAGAYIPVRIDIDVWPELARKYEVRSIPLVVVMDDQGKVLRSIAGARDSAEMIEWLSAGN